MQCTPITCKWHLSQLDYRKCSDVHQLYLWCKQQNILEAVRGKHLFQCILCLCLPNAHHLKKIHYRKWNYDWNTLYHEKENKALENTLKAQNENLQNKISCHTLLRLIPNEKSGHSAEDVDLLCDKHLYRWGRFLQGIWQLMTVNHNSFGPLLGVLVEHSLFLILKQLLK